MPRTRRSSPGAFLTSVTLRSLPPRFSLRYAPTATARSSSCSGTCWLMITLDPDRAEKTPGILKAVAQAHEGMAGVYGAVLLEGMIHKGDSVELMD